MIFPLQHEKQNEGEQNMFPKKLKHQKCVFKDGKQWIMDKRDPEHTALPICESDCKKMPLTAVCNLMLLVHIPIVSKEWRYILTLQWMAATIFLLVLSV